jgi:hypothetical protein
MVQFDTESLDFHLSVEAERELKRLGTHPIREVRRLRDEVRDGEVGTAMTLLIVGIGLGVWIVAAVILVVIILVTD